MDTPSQAWIGCLCGWGSDHAWWEVSGGILTCLPTTRGLHEQVDLFRAGSSRHCHHDNLRSLGWDTGRARSPMQSPSCGLHNPHSHTGVPSMTYDTERSLQSSDRYAGIAEHWASTLGVPPDPYRALQTTHCCTGRVPLPGRLEPKS